MKVNFLQELNFKSLGDFDQENEVFMENVKSNEHFGKLLKIFDQKQKDLVVRALVYYRNIKFGAKVDKGIGVNLFS